MYSHTDVHFPILFIEGQLVVKYQPTICHFPILNLLLCFYGSIHFVGWSIYLVFTDNIYATHVLIGFLFIHYKHQIFLPTIKELISRVLFLYEKLIMVLTSFIQFSMLIRCAS
jgi:hypothetical protein